MRGSAYHFLGVLILGSAIVGCGGKKNKTAMNDPYDYQAVDPSTPAGGDPYLGSQTTTGGGYDTYSTSGSKTHTVQKKETLYSIARMYYNGDHTKWKVIYEANRDQITNKDQIRVGQKLIIP